MNRANQHERGSSVDSSTSLLSPSRVSPTPRGRGHDRGRDRRQFHLVARLVPATAAGACEAD